MHQHNHARARSARVGALTIAIAALATAATLLVASPAAAHVHVEGEASPGEPATLTFRVPTESDSASTTGLRVEFPIDAPIPTARVQSKPGWTSEIVTERLDPPATLRDGSTIAVRVVSITWTATGAGIAPGEFDTFVVSTGAIPDVDEIVLPATQTYDDGRVVEWSEVGGGSEEPQHPAPVLLVGASADSPHSSDGGHASASPEPGAVAPGRSAGASDAAVPIGIAALAVGVAGVALAVTALTRSRRRA